METAGNLVGTLVELTSGVEDGQHDLKGTLVFLLMHIDRDTTAIVDHGNRIVLIDGHLDMGTESRKSLVYRVVDDLIHKMVETLLADVAYIHGRTLADSLQAFKHLDIARAVFLAVFCLC